MTMANEGYQIIVDTGPIVAYLNKRDRYHDWGVDQFSIFAPPFLSCEAVISKACFLLRSYPNGSRNVLELVERELIHLSFNL